MQSKFAWFPCREGSDDHVQEPLERISSMYLTGMTYLFIREIVLV
jgi:hypothetical protein